MLNSLSCDVPNLTINVGALQVVGLEPSPDGKGVLLVTKKKRGKIK